ncbi:hypothetical protein [Methanosarcina sp. MTP4]|uniref:hypothetical protein n=1 Tax=Methanosarcina sp. MTP4 TaxID=1434100 RepID=UPI0018CEA851|nr:hypothetical protein [Methanosarcina sp. MTP4]
MKPEKTPPAIIPIRIPAAKVENNSVRFMGTESTVHIINFVNFYDKGQKRDLKTK